MVVVELNAEVQCVPQKFKSILSKIYELEIKGAFKILTSSESLTDLLMLYLCSFNERN